MNVLSAVKSLLGPKPLLMLNEFQKESSLWLQDNLKHPRLLTQWIEKRSPWLAKFLLSAASEVMEPHLLGMGLKVQRVDDESLEVLLPLRWKNKTPSGEIQLGALMTMVEFSLKIFWERHLDYLQSEFFVSNMNLSLNEPIKETVVARLHLDSLTSDQWLFQIRAHGRLEVMQEVVIYNLSDRRLACVEAQLNFKSVPLLSGREL